MKRISIQQLALLAMLLIFSSLGAQNTITGVIYYHENDEDPLPNVTVELYDSNDVLFATTTTNDAGEFEFTSIPAGEYYILSDATLVSGDITMEDADLVLDYLNGTNGLNEYEFEAADINGNGNVNHGDYQQIVNKVLGHGNAFPDEWKFEEIAIDFTARDFGEDTTEVWGTSTGDVEGIWKPGGRDLDVLEELQFANVVNLEETELVISSSYNDFINGFNLNLTYPADLIEITDVIGPDENFRYRLDENNGVLNVFWLDENAERGIMYTGENLFKVKVRQIQNSTQTEEGMFTLSEGGMVLDARSNKIEDISIKLPMISTTSNKLELEIAGYPNPVKNNFNFSITSPKSNNASIQVYDLVGRLVKETNNVIIYKGVQLINMNTENLPVGHYVYKIRMRGINDVSGRFYKTN